VINVLRVTVSIIRQNNYLTDYIPVVYHQNGSVGIGFLMIVIEVTYI